MHILYLHNYIYLILYIYNKLSLPIALYCHDSSMKQRMIEICLQEVLLLKCLGPSDNEWYGLSQEVCMLVYMCSDVCVGR